MRLGASGETVEMTPSIKKRIQEAIFEYGTTKTLRCLGLAVVDEPLAFKDYDLRNPANYVKYEVCLFISVSMCVLTFI